MLTWPVTVKVTCPECGAEVAVEAQRVDGAEQWQVTARHRGGNGSIGIAWLAMVSDEVTEGHARQTTVGTAIMDMLKKHHG